MKKMFKLFMCAAVVAAGFTACSEEVNPIGPEPGGTTETGLLRINLQNPTTYADDPDNAIPSESKVNNVTIFVFDLSGVCKVDTVVDMSSVASASDNTYKDININVPLGRHYVYAGVNLTTDGANKMRATVHSGIKNFVNLGALNQPALAEIDSLYAPNKFPMFSADRKDVSIQPTLPTGDIPDANKITINLDRMVAKITVHKNANFKDDNLKAAGAIFSSTDLSWDLGNLNAKIYPYGKAIITKDDPNFDFGDRSLPTYPNILQSTDGKKYRAENFTNAFNTITAGDWKGFAAKVNDNGTAVKDRDAKYAPENNSFSKRKGESTFTVIKVKFAPDVVVEFPAGATAPKQVQGYTPNLNAKVKYFVLRGDGQIFYFDGTNGSDDADRFKAYLETQGHTGVTVTPYNDQYCFYRLLMGKEKDDKGNVWRNYFYEIRLNKINGLGTPTGELPEEEVDETADNKGLLDVTIDINKWVFVDTDEDLG
jgi:hypothetical protein